MRAFGAMLLDSYRELNSRKMFWIILFLSTLLVIVYGSIGFDDDGINLFFGLWQIEQPALSADSPLSRTLYRSIFTSFIVSIWLAWIATILALISTASIFPDFIAGGSVDLVLCRPIRRVTLFFMKYVSSLLFVAVQVAIVCLGAFLCMGLRLGDWEWQLFLAIPIVVVFFSYLFSICVFIGVWTRSALAALLLTLLAWFGLYTLNAAEATLGLFKHVSIIQAEEIEESLNTSNVTSPSATLDLRDAAETLEKWETRVHMIRWPLPKTDLTIAQLDKLLVRDTDLLITNIMAGRFRRNAEGEFVPLDENTGNEQQRIQNEASRRMAKDYTDQSPYYVIGTSLAFEAVVLALACFIFVRRDY